MEKDDSKKVAGSGSPDNEGSLEHAAGRLTEDIQQQEIFPIPVDKIMPNRFQHRMLFKKPAIEGLAASIKRRGQLQPIIVRKVTDENIPFTFELIAGERRLRAVKLLGQPTINAVITDKSDRDAKTDALIENLQREETTYFETMKCIRDLKDEYEDIEIVALEISKHRRSVEQYLKCFSEISSIPEIFETVENQQENLRKKDLLLIASIMPSLRKLQKSNKLLFERFMKKSAKKGIAEAAEKLSKEKEKKERGDGGNGSFFSDNNGKLTFRILVQKGQSFSDEDTSRMRSEFEEFMGKIDTLKVEITP